jgi:hypothetical protein
LTKYFILAVRGFALELKKYKGLLGRRFFTENFLLQAEVSDGEKSDTPSLARQGRWLDDVCRQSYGEDLVACFDGT